MRESVAFLQRNGLALKAHINYRLINIEISDKVKENNRILVKLVNVINRKMSTNIKREYLIYWKGGWGVFSELGVEVESCRWSDSSRRKRSHECL